MRQPLTVDCLSRLEPVRGLSAARLADLAAHCHAESFALGSDPLTPRTVPHSLVYLLAGELKLELPDGSIQVLVGGCDAALWPLGYQKALPLRSRAITEVRLLRLDFELLDLLLTWDEIASPVRAEAAVPLPAAMTGASPLVAATFAALPAASMAALQAAFVRQPVAAGQVLVREGEPGCDYYLLESGRAQVTRRTGGAELCLASLRRGDTFGEESLVTGAPRNATIRMLSDGVVLRLGQDAFKQILQTALLRTLPLAVAEQRVAAGLACWLDVRYPAEFAENGRPGARNLPLNELRTAFAILPPDREYLCDCRGGRRSMAAAFLLARAGFAACYVSDLPEGGAPE